MNIAQTRSQTPDEIRQERALYERSPAGVAAAILGNCAGGLGVAFVVGVICYWLGASSAMLVRITVSAWLIAWGAIMALWFSQDELSVVALQHTNRQLAAHLDDAEDEIATLQAELATVRHENGIFSWRIQEAERNRNFLPATSPETAAYRDARELIRAWAGTGEHPARRKLGWTESRHSAAMYILQSRNIVTVGRGNVVTWQAPDPPTALAMLASQQSLPEGWPAGSASRQVLSDGVDESQT